MATSVASQPRLTVGVEDPFSSTTPQPSRPQSHRYSSFDTQLFALNHPSASPSQAKRALEAHLAETERRLQEASRLGTTLVQQRKKLSERLRDVEAHQADEEIGPELRQKLIDIEKEYTEVSRESVRAFMGPKSQEPTEAPNAPFALDGRVSTVPGTRPANAYRDTRILLVQPSLLGRRQTPPRKLMCRGSSETNLRVEPKTWISQQKSLRHSSSKSSNFKQHSWRRKKT